MRKNVLILGHNDATQFIDIYNQYTKLFDPAKYEVTVAYLSGAPNKESKARTIAENVLFLNVPTKKLRSLKISAISALLKLCKEKNFETVICHRYKPSYIMLWVAQFHKIPALLCVMHELETMSSFGRRLITGILGRKNVIFAGVSNAVRDDMRKDMWFVPNEKIVTLYNMIDIDLTEPKLLSRDEARKELHLSKDDFVYGNIARLAHNKDQDSLIEAFSRIKVNCPNAKLIIIGDGELEHALKEKVNAKGLEKDILFTGFLANAFRYMKAFDCFVLSSIQEAFGRVLIEAMVAKTPIIATRVNGIPEVVGDIGTLIDARNPQELAIAMQQIYFMSDSERAAAGEKAYRYVTDHYSIPKFQEAFWQLPIMQSIV